MAADEKKAVEEPLKLDDTDADAPEPAAEEPADADAPVRRQFRNATERREALAKAAAKREKSKEFRAGQVVHKPIPVPKS